MLRDSARRLALFGCVLVCASRLAAAGGAAHAQGDERFRDYPETDVLAYDIELGLDPQHATVHGREHIRIRAQQELRAVRLDSKSGPDWTLAFHLEKESEAPLAVTREADERVSLALPRPVHQGEEFTLAVDFAGHPPDGLYFGRSRTGEAWVYTDHYSIRAHGWLPCEDHPGDRARFEARLDGERVHLTKKEFDLLWMLIVNRGRVVTRDSILARLWDYDADVETRTVDVHIRSLRRKLGDQRIETVVGLGYRYGDPGKEGGTS